MVDSLKINGKKVELKENIQLHMKTEVNKISNLDITSFSPNKKQNKQNEFSFLNNLTN